MVIINSIIIFGLKMRDNRIFLNGTLRKNRCGLMKQVVMLVVRSSLTLSSFVFIAAPYILCDVELLLKSRVENHIRTQREGREEFCKSDLVNSGVQTMKQPLHTPAPGHGLALTLDPESSERP